MWKSPCLSAKPLKDSELGLHIRRDSILLVSPWWVPRAGSSPTVDLQPQQDKYSYVPGLPPFPPPPWLSGIALYQQGVGCGSRQGVG